MSDCTAGGVLRAEQKDQSMSIDPLGNTSVDPTIVNGVRTFTDEQTGREVRQLTDFEHGAHLGYFRMYRQVPDGRMLAWGTHENGRAILIDPATGDLELLAHPPSSLKFRESDGRNWYITCEDDHQGMKLCHVDLPGGEPIIDVDLPGDLPGGVEDITIDGRYLILNERHQDLSEHPIPTTKDVATMTHYFSRPRHGAIWAYDTVTGRTEQLLTAQDITPLHLDTSPLDPTLLRYAMDMPETKGQRMWTMRIDGSDRKPIRAQARGEMVTHEFWWADANHIGYTYQDRRADPTVEDHHWAEYALADTRLGIADLNGQEVYLSDPLNSYHTHLYRSPDGTLVSGEGTDGHCFVYAGAFSMENTRIDMVPLATTHATYVPFRGQGVDCNFSADGRWLIYADQLDPDGPRQLFAVEVDL